MSAPPPAGPSGQRRQLPPGSLRLGTVAGIDVIVARSWFLVLGLLAILIAPRIQQEVPGIGSWGYAAAAAYAVLLYGSVLLHEISHALAARAFNMPVRSITLNLIGGLTEIEGEARTPWREFVIAVVGPLTSLGVAGACGLIQRPLEAGVTHFTVASLAWANLVVGVLNLVPGLPLDGGRVLQSVVWAITRRRSTGIVVAAWGGRLAAVAAVAVPFVLTLLGRPPQVIGFLIFFMIGAFLWGGANNALAWANLQRRLPDIDARRLARPAIGVPGDLPLGETVRRAREAHAGSVVVVTSDGRPAGVVNEAALLSTPEARRPWLATSILSRSLEDGLLLPADLKGEPLLRAMQRTPASEYVLVEPDGSVYGVLATKDVDQALGSR